jgi:hypothetical protein
MWQSACSNKPTFHWVIKNWGSVKENQLGFVQLTKQWRALELTVVHSAYFSSASTSEKFAAGSSHSSHPHRCWNDKAPCSCTTRQSLKAPTSDVAKLKGGRPSTWCWRCRYSGGSAVLPHHFGITAVICRNTRKFTIRGDDSTHNNPITNRGHFR